MGFPRWSRDGDFFGDSQPVLAAEFFGYSGGSVTDEGGVVDLPTEADPIGDDVDMLVVGVFCGAYSMVGGDENGCDYGPLPRALRLGEQVQFVGTN